MKKKLRFFWVTISMRNFVRNPFFAFINATEQFLRSKTLSKDIQRFLIFSIAPTSLVVFSISSVANSKIKKSGRGGRAHLSFKKKIKAIRALSSAAALADRLREMTLLLAEKPVHLHEPTHMYRY